jgi:hypothetical protein
MYLYREWSSLRCCAKTPPCFLAVLFRTTHFDPVFLLVLWLSPSVSPCPGLTNRNWVLPSVPYIYRSSNGKAILPPWRWRRYVPPKCRVQLYGLHGVISQKMILFKTTAVKTSNPTKLFSFLINSSIYNFRGSNIWAGTEYRLDVCRPTRSTDMAKYLISFYTFHLKRLACIFTGSKVIQFLYQVCSFHTSCIIFFSI